MNRVQDKTKVINALAGGLIEGLDIIEEDLGVKASACYAAAETYKLEIERQAQLAALHMTFNR